MPAHGVSSRFDEAWHDFVISEVRKRIDDGTYEREWGSRLRRVFGKAERRRNLKVRNV